MFSKLITTAFFVILGIGVTLCILGSQWAADAAQAARDWWSPGNRVAAHHNDANSPKAMSTDQLSAAIETEIAQCARRAAEVAADAAVAGDEADGLAAQIARLDDQIRAEEQLLHRLRPLLAEQRDAYEFDGQTYSFATFATDVERRALALERLQQRRADLHTRLDQLRTRLARGDQRQIEFRTRLEQLHLDFEDLVCERAFAAQDVHLARLISAVDDLPTGMDERLGRLLREYRRRIATDRALACNALGAEPTGISYGAAEPVGQRAHDALSRVLDGPTLTNDPTSVSTEPRSADVGAGEPSDMAVVTARD